MHLLSARPPAKAISLSPLSADELDAMGDEGLRMWATIYSLQAELDAEIERREDENSHLIYDQDELNAAMDEAREQCIKDVEEILDDSDLSNIQKIEALELLT